MEVLTGSGGKEITSVFFEPALAEIVELVGLALLDRDERQPAAAFTAVTAGTGCDWRNLRIHAVILWLE